MEDFNSGSLSVESTKIDVDTWKLENDYSRPIQALLKANPFYGLYLMGIKRFEINDSDIPIAAVGLDGVNFSLLLRAQYTETLEDGNIRKGGFLSLPLPQQIGTLKHEVMHLAFEHLFLFKDPQYNKKILNVACDLEINQLIPRFELPSRGCFIDGPEFREFNLPRNAGSLTYYHLLLKEKEKAESNQERGLELSLGQQNLLNLKDDPTHKDFSEAFQDDDDNQISEEDFWNTVKTINDSAVSNAYSQCVELYGETKARGLLPGSLTDKINKLLTKKEEVLPWRRIFHRFVGSANLFETKKTYKKESQRFPGMPAIKKKRRCKVLCVIDTSGSVSNNELSHFARELDFIASGNVQVDVVCADAEVQSATPYKKESFLEIKGRGGTDFTPAVAFFNQKLEYTALIYLTDGACSPPDILPNRPALWVFSRKGDYSSFPGYRVIMNNIEN